MLTRGLELLSRMSERVQIMGAEDVEFNSHSLI